MTDITIYRVSRPLSTLPRQLPQKLYQPIFLFRLNRSLLPARMSKERQPRQTREYKNTTC